MRGKGRTLAHNVIRDTLYALASKALLNPDRESPCFGENQQRMDLVLRAGFGGIAQLIDVAMTYPLRADAIHLAISAGPDAVATRYTEVKWSEYGRLISPTIQTFTPVVYDTFGGLNACARPLLSSMATQYGARISEGIRHGRLQFYARLNRTVIAEAAKLAYRDG
jgi:hypothetical protein